MATIRVAVFNTDISDEYPLVGASLVANAIRRSGADVVSIEEAGAQIPRIAHELGWRYYDVRMQIISRLPLIDPPGGDGVYTFVQVAPGAVAAVENVHLPSDPYGPNYVRDHRPVGDVLALERRVRLPAILPALAAARRLQRLGMPVFLTGDFNAPSWRDWTPAMIGARRFMRYPVRWTVSIAVEQAGFRDSFRTVHRDPRATPGLTWPTVRTIPGLTAYPLATNPADRIDFVYATLNATPTASSMIGEPHAAGVTATAPPWPSDHRLIVSTFRVRGSQPANLVSVASRTVTAGQRIAITYFASPTRGRSVAILSAATGRIVWRVGLARTAPHAATIEAASSALGAGVYIVELVTTAGRILTRYGFFIVPPRAAPTMSTTPTAAVGAPITITIRNGPGERWDWVAIYPLGADPTVTPYLAWVYTQATIDGAATLDQRTAQGTWPVLPGTYSVYLLKDDLYVQVAATTIRIAPPGPPVHQKPALRRAEQPVLRRAAFAGDTPGASDGTLTVSGGNEASPGADFWGAQLSR